MLHADAHLDPLNAEQSKNCTGSDNVTAMKLLNEKVCPNLNNRSFFFLALKEIVEVVGSGSNDIHTARSILHREFTAGALHLHTIDTNHVVWKEGGVLVTAYV